MVELDQFLKVLYRKMKECETKEQMLALVERAIGLSEDHLMEKMEQEFGLI